MSIEAWITLSVVGVCFVLLVRNRVSPDLVMSAGLTLLLLLNVISPEQALVGFANEGMLTVAVLYVVVSGVRETGGVSWLVRIVLGRPRNIAYAQLKVMAPVMVLSAFVNNTPVVAMFIPAVQEWAKRYRLSVSKLLMPMSFAAIVGGTCTLIGTSTNLVVYGLLISSYPELQFSMFDIAWLGIPAVIITLPYVLIVSRYCLPERKPVISQFENAREYVVEMIVEEQSPLQDQTIEAAGLRQLPGLFLIELERNGQVIPAVSPTVRLKAGDRLLFAGVVESVVDLQKIRGLKPATTQIFKIDSPRHEHRLIEAVISNSCPLVGKSIRGARFRNIYNAAVVGVARNGERIKQRIGDIVLRAGDTLLLVTRPSFVEQQRNSRDFFLVSLIEDTVPINHDRALVAGLIMILMVATAASGVLSMLKAVLLAAGLMLITRCTRASIARKAVDWQLLIVIATSFGIGNALYSTGAAQAIAQAMLSFSGGHPSLALIAIFVLTATFTSIATNNVAAVLMFPIAAATANTLEVSLLPFAAAIMMGASASFATPIGYQTNLMVYGAGGYVFSDYLRMGIPLTLLVGGVTILVAPWVWPF